LVYVLEDVKKKYLIIGAFTLLDVNILVIREKLPWIPLNLLCWTFLRHFCSHVYLLAKNPITFLCNSLAFVHPLPLKRP